MKFDKKDKKLIAYLYHHYREPLTKIAKACRISRDQVEYRLRKFENQGLIKKYLTIFNYNLLGYNEFAVVWLKTSNRDMIKKELENMKNVVSVGEVITNYDLFVDFIFRDKTEFENVFYSFLDKHKGKIKDFRIFTTTYAEIFPLKVFGISGEEKSYEMVSVAEKIELDKKDLDILRILETNGRARIIDIASQTNLSSELVLYRLKQLNKNKLVLGTRILFDMEKMGFYFGVLRLKFKNLDEKIKAKVKSFCKSHKQVNALSFGISEHNCLIQIFYEQEEELRKSIREINKEFRQEIDNSELLLIENEGRVKTFPF